MKRSACSLVALGAFSFYSLYVGARIFAASGHARAGLEGAEKQEPRLLDLLAKLDAKDPDDREAAAKELAKREGEAIVPALRKRAGIERDFHVRLALHYALAFHGDRQALKVLAEALSQRGHLGFVYLHDVTGRDFEWEISDWKKWIEETSDSDFRKIVAERRVPAEEQNAGWDEFLAAVTCLQERGDRPAAARRFRWVADQYPRSTFGRQSKELSELLATMVQEDQAWKEPADNSKLTVEEQITYNVYKLREVTCYQIMQPGMCSVLEPFGQKEGTYNAAIELRKIGPPAVPRLIKLLEDRRPTRSVGYWRSFRRDRTVLRYQDAAIEILNELLPAAFYRESSTRAYFSNEFPEVRVATIAAIRRWYTASQGKSSTEQMWLAVPEVGIYPALKLLRKLAEDPAQKPKVVGELRRMFDNRHWIFQPHVAEALADLGDRSKVSEVLQSHRRGKYSTYSIRRPDDSAASLNAQDAAKRLLQKYGSEKSPRGDER